MSIPKVHKILQNLLHDSLTSIVQEVAKIPKVDAE